MGINRNIVECKAYLLTRSRSSRHCINRNIVECKEYTKREQQELLEGINRNIVECKVWRPVRVHCGR